MGCAAALLDPLAVRELGVVANGHGVAGRALDCRLDDQLRSRVIRRLIGIEITDAITATAAAWRAARCSRVADVRVRGRKTWPASRRSCSDMNQELKAFLLKNFYHHPTGDPHGVQGKPHAHRHLSAPTWRNPGSCPGRCRRAWRTGPDSPHRVICDYHRRHDGPLRDQGVQAVV